MSYNQHVAVIQRLNSAFRETANDPKFVGFRVLIEGATARVCAVYDSSAELSPSHVPFELKVLDGFAAQLVDLGIDKVASTILYEPPATAHAARGGDAAWGNGLVGNGTLGWTLFLDGQLISISNWHVFCAQGNATPLGTACFAASVQIGTLGYFDQVSIPGRNLWDFAYAIVTDPSQVMAEMRNCDDGSRRPYPLRLGDQGLCASGRKYHKVGARAPICRSGYFKGVGGVRVDYGTAIATFENQLLFAKMSDPGDSGAMITEEQTNHIVGLNFAGGDDLTIANPIFNKGWKATGTKLSGDVVFPTFESGREADPFIGSNTQGSNASKRQLSLLDFPGMTTSDLPSEIAIGSTWLYVGPLNGAAQAIGINAITSGDIQITSFAGAWMGVNVFFAKSPAYQRTRGWLHAGTGIAFLK